MLINSNGISIGELSDVLQALSKRAAELYEDDPGMTLARTGQPDGDTTPQGVFFNLMLQLCDEIEESQVRDYVRQFLEGL